MTAVAMKRPALTRADVYAKLADHLGRLRERRSARLKMGRTTKPHASDALRALCLGSISVDDYLTTKLDQAISPLKELLPPDDIAAIRLAMLERIYTEPIWCRVVEQLRATVARERSDRGSDDER